MEAIGVTTFWGSSPALDLQDPIDTWSEQGIEAMKLLHEESGHQDSAAPFNVLIAGAGDARNLLKTMCRAWRWPSRPLHIYICERKPEPLARQLLMLTLLFDNKLSINERVEMYLEITGNTMLRENTANYINKKATELSNFIADFDGILLSLVDLDLLKTSQRDELDNVTKTWRNDVPFDVQKLRDERMRLFYKDRYDHRANLVDWDYTMNLSTNPGCTVIHPIQFRDWRETGVAYEIRDSAYTHPNRTLASRAVGLEQGVKVGRQGFWGDIVSSPFISFGITCDDPLFFRKRNDTHIKTTHEVSHHNVRSLLYELELSRPYKDPTAADEPYQTPSVSEVVEDGPKSTGLLFLPNNVKVFCLLGDVDVMFGKKRFSGLFSRAFISNVSSHQLKPELNDLLTADAVVSVETAQYVLVMRAEQRTEYVRKVTELALDLGWRACTPARHPHSNAPADAPVPSSGVLTFLRGLHSVVTPAPASTVIPVTKGP
eukprot:TRINITY_DN12016_c0_g1_i1.p1 TRINITY_DN12016_c0_g1~~TRINITY_DN12016_c0_g1_i1.p1  ORF type:complete len:497 (-),score=87.11 TRINITY_DN12016_c0_g1_i1:185-1648(-)